jgi:beta-glucosidase
MARQTVLPRPLLVLAAIGLLAAALVAQQPAASPPAARPPADAAFRNAALAIEPRVDAILAAMTLDEKLACLQTSTAVPRLGIPDIGGAEGLHQLVRKGGFGPEKPIPTTSFALTLGLGATWDPALLQRAGAAQAIEARYITQHPKYRQPVLVNWLNVDLARDPRWGRYEESYGEDPFLVGTLASGYIRGIQGDDPKYWRAAALLKHYVANSNETTRTRSSSDFDAQLFREYYSVPFRMAIEDGGARSFMASYNKWNGVPMLLHPTARTVLAGEWGLDGIFSTDLAAVGHLVNHQKHVATIDEALAATIKAGYGQLLWFAMMDGAELRPVLDRILASKQVTEADIDAALRGKFRTLIRLGLLDPADASPYAKIGGVADPEPWTTDAHKTLAGDVARASVVLLKNAGGALPLDRAAVTSIAVIGPRADKVMTDFYGGPTPYAVSVLDGIRVKLGTRTTVTHADGSDAAAAVSAAKTAGAAVVVVGNDPMCGTTNPMEMFNQDGSTKPCADKGMGREGRDRESLDLSDEALIKQVFAANPRTIVVLVSSFPYAITWSQAHVPAILHITHAAQEQGTAIADVLFGDYNPGGHLTTTWPASLDQLPPLESYDIRKGHTYQYFKGQPLYAFGHGLSYSTFEYANLRLSAPSIAKNGAVSVSVTIKNTSARAGDEVAQLYVEHVGSKVSRPMKALKGFQRVSLEPGESRTIQLPLKADALAFWDEAQNAWRLEAGTVKLSVGSSSTLTRSSTTLTVQ